MHLVAYWHGHAEEEIFPDYKATSETLFKFNLYSPLQLGQVSCGITQILIPGMTRHDPFRCQEFSSSGCEIITVLAETLECTCKELLQRFITYAKVVHWKEDYIK